INRVRPNRQVGRNPTFHMRIDLADVVDVRGFKEPPLRCGRRAQDLPSFFFFTEVDLHIGRFHSMALFTSYDGEQNKNDELVIANHGDVRMMVPSTHSVRSECKSLPESVTSSV